MTKFETEFLDEYKRVDNMLKDAYSSQNGFSSYISMMEKSPGNRAALIPSWNSDYKMLKRLRWLRNKIAHDTRSAELTSSDLEDLKEFRKRFQKKQDPLTVSEQLRKRSDAKKAQNARSSDVKKTSSLAEKKPFPWARVIIGALVALVLYMIIRTGGKIF